MASYWPHSFIGVFIVLHSVTVEKHPKTSFANIQSITHTTNYMSDFVAFRDTNRDTLVSLRPETRDVATCGSWRKWVQSKELDSGAPAARRAAKRSPMLIWGRKGTPSTNFLTVIIASGIARRRVRTTMTARRATKSRKTAAIIQIAWQRHTALVYCVLFWYGTSMLWSIDTCQNKVSADPYHVTISRA